MQEEVILVFQDIKEAIMAEHKLRDAHLELSVMPMPRNLGPACRMALRIQQKDIKKAETVLNDLAFSIHALA